MSEKLVEYRPRRWAKVVDGRIVGRATPEEVAAFLRRFLEAGASYLILNIRGAAELAPLELFGERVLPLLRL